MGSNLDEIQTLLEQIKTVHDRINEFPSKVNHDAYDKILTDSGLINSNDAREKLIRKKNVGNLMSGIDDLSTSLSHREWLFKNICDLQTVFAQQQTDITVPEGGWTQYTGRGANVPVSAPYAILAKLQKVEQKRCRHDGICRRCDAEHFKQYTHLKHDLATNRKTATAAQSLLALARSPGPSAVRHTEMKKFGRSQRRITPYGGNYYKKTRKRKRKSKRRKSRTRKRNSRSKH